MPQQAAGAIWRAARTVVVGDPKQLEPVSGIPPTVEGALAQHYGVPPFWWPGEISAQVLADQTMNLGTRLPDPDNVGKNCEGNWVLEEGEAVKKLLLDLRNIHHVLPENIFLISPFRDCARKLWMLAGHLGFDTRKIGTVHTTQGKEARVVVLVLGGNIQKPGARAWAASRPNLLNVAVSRAKQRLYVIGDRAQWQKQRYFSTLAKNLPTNGAL